MIRGSDGASPSREFELGKLFVRGAMLHACVGMLDHLSGRHGHASVGHGTQFRLDLGLPLAISDSGRGRAAVAVRYKVEPRNEKADPDNEKRLEAISIPCSRSRQLRGHALT